MNEALAVLVRTWSPDAFSFAGDFYQYDNINVTPKPVQDPMPLWIGGLSQAAVRRAARFGTGFMAGAGPDRITEYLDHRAKAGKPPGAISKGVPFVAVAVDPDREWAALGPHVQYQRFHYARWLAEAGTPIWQAPATPDAIRAVEPDIVVTPSRARAIIQDMLLLHPQISHIYLAPVPPGLRPSQASETLRLFAEEVAPHFR
jgi:alkanesulfonate monooxygenase SsuD/methylene tetrahydromethanopterin reductase-like flavin-dependent oxidoreductase (luciferase family)